MLGANYHHASSETRRTVIQGHVRRTRGAHQLAVQIQQRTILNIDRLPLFVQALVPPFLLHLELKFKAALYGVIDHWKGHFEVVLLIVLGILGQFPAPLPRRGPFQLGIQVYGPKCFILVYLSFRSLFALVE